MIKISSTIILFLFSLHYSDKLINLIQKNDPLMKTIINKESSYLKEPVNAIITKQTIIPGISGHKLDIKKSYQKMKKLGTYNENLIVLKKISPKISYINNYDKIIIPRKTDNVALIFEIKDRTILESIDHILKNNNTYANIINNTFPILNTNFINTLSTNGTGTDYCIAYQLNINKDCINNKVYTILIKNNTINNYHLNKTKNIIDKQNILIYNFNKNNINELILIIKYLKNNHYNIVSIDELIKE